MANYLLDTNALSELRKPRPNLAFVEWLQAIFTEQLFISCLTIGEIQKGAHQVRQPSQQAQLVEFVNQMVQNYQNRIVIIDQETCLLWGELLATARKIGKTPPAIDSLLAAQAIQHNLTLVTHNLKDFEQFSELKLLCPWN